MRTDKKLIESKFAENFANELKIFKEKVYLKMLNRLI